MNKMKTKRSCTTLSLNEDRGDAEWQIERGPRYGNSRKVRSKAKHQERKSSRRKERNEVRKMETE